jgi:hypothetical protein
LLTLVRMNVLALVPHVLVLIQQCPQLFRVVRRLV